jgi:acetyltransferase-like isoleucine patch superfamily enzyme
MAFSFRRLLSTVVCLTAPPVLKPWLLSRLGHPISSGARIGLSFVFVDRLAMAKGSSIGHLNFIVARRIAMRENAYIRSLNIIRRGMSLRFARKAAIGNRNKVVRGWTPQPVRPAILTLGELSKLTSDHYIEMSESIRIGNFTTLAGVRSQIWTHGYVHDETGPGRSLITGRVIIGDNVYIGSGCILNCGIRIANSVSIGSGSSVAKSLDKPGVYVSQPLRYVDHKPEERLVGLQRVEGASPEDLHYRRLP